MPFSQIEHAFQQTGFKREKRYGRPRNTAFQAGKDSFFISNKAHSLYFELKTLYCLFSNVISLEPKEETDPSETWSSLREALDREHAMDELEELAQFDPHVVHDENYFNRIQNSEKHKNDKRGYNPLKVENLVDIPLSVLDQDTDPTDPLFQHQWYLKNTGQNGGKPKLDLNVQQAWAQGVTGKNITTAIMDDGVDYMHPDLIRNYVSSCFAIKQT